MQKEVKEINLSLEEEIRELTEENAMLLKQLHATQADLEKYYYKLKECVQLRHAENPSIGDAQLDKILQIQKEFIEAETQNSFHARLGKELERIYHSGSLFTLPFRLFSLRKIFFLGDIPAGFGGKEFTQIIDVYTSGGKEEVEKLLDSVEISPIIRANAYTALAKEIKQKNIKMCLHYARLAYFTDPRPYRLKYLILRFYDTNDMLSATIAAAFLPKDIKLSPHEASIIKSLHEK